jgi:hypothetical protein
LGLRRAHPVNSPNTVRGIQSAPLPGKNQAVAPMELCYALDATVSKVPSKVPMASSWSALSELPSMVLLGKKFLEGL